MFENINTRWVIDWDTKSYIFVVNRQQNKYNTFRKCCLILILHSFKISLTQSCYITLLQPAVLCNEYYILMILCVQRSLFAILLLIITQNMLSLSIYFIYLEYLFHLFIHGIVSSILSEQLSKRVLPSLLKHLHRNRWN